MRKWNCIQIQLHYVGWKNSSHQTWILYFTCTRSSTSVAPVAPVSQTLTSDQLSVAKLLVTSAKVDSSYVFTLSVCLSVSLSVGRITQKVVVHFSEISGGVRCMQARYTSRRPINGVNALKWNAWLLIFVLEYCFEQLAHVGPPGEWLKSRRYSNNLRLYFSVSSGTLNSTIPYYTFQ